MTHDMHFALIFRYSATQLKMHETKKTHC